MKQPGESLWFVPGRPAPLTGPLARYRPLQPVGAAGEYVRRLTAPGDLVLDLFCQGPNFLREAVAAGRRAVGVGVNPLSLLIAGLGLEPPVDPAALSAAFTRLADSPKGERPLQRYMAAIYSSRCPTCGANGTAEWFAWDRAAGYPYAKAVRCASCAQAQQGSTDEADIAEARRWEGRGLAYHYALNRAAPADHPARERAAELVELYTPRNLSALIDVTLRLEGLELERPLRAVLQGLLLTAYDRGSGLDAHGESRPRPRVLRLPARFVERNVWLLLEDELNGLLAAPVDDKTPVRRAASLAALLAGREVAYTLVSSAARDVGGLLPPGSVSLVLVDPPRPDGVFWALCALWAGWLWDAPLAHAMRPLLRRRRFDWEWHQEVLQSALSAAAPLLTAEGTLVTILIESEEELIESLCQAATGAGYELAGWGASPELGYRLAWCRSGQAVALAPVTGEPAEAERRTAAALARGALLARGEPTPRLLLHAAACTGLSAAGTRCTGGVVQQGLAQLALCEWGEEAPLLWLSAEEETNAAPPLADRVEETVWRLLQTRPSWPTGELLLAVYAAFDGPLTPELALVLQCFESYGQSEDGQWHLRQEDEAERRAHEMAALQAELGDLGRRLALQVTAGHGWNVRWQEEGQDLYLFALSSTAALERCLVLGGALPPGARPCMVFPGGRAELLAARLRRDPRLAQRVAEQGWQWIKFRHLRRLIAEGLDRRLFETVLGLDPIVEREGVQIPLAWERDKKTKRQGDTETRE